MFPMRPGTSIRFFTPRFRNKPDVRPPGLLQLAGALSVLSVAGMLVYSTFEAMGPSGNSVSAAESVYVALVHFVIPLGIFYTISTNSPASRYLIALYILVVYIATLGDRGMLGKLAMDPTLRLTMATGVVATLFAWLFVSPKMRAYYALLRDAPIPPRLVARADALLRKAAINPRLRARLDKLAELLEIVVIVGAIATVIYAFTSTGW